MTTMRIPDSDQQALLRLARAAIADRLERSGALASTLNAIDTSDALGEPGSSFVTLKTTGAAGGKLRGCMGSMGCDEPLYRNVIKNAQHAAFDDPRFAPVASTELGSLRVSISVLSQPQAIDDPAQIEIGRDGVEMVWEDKRAVFLPQVPVENGWDRERLLEQLARKAGVPGLDWNGARLAIFRTDSFGE